MLDNVMYNWTLGNMNSFIDNSSNEITFKDKLVMYKYAILLKKAQSLYSKKTGIEKLRLQKYFGADESIGFILASSLKDTHDCKFINDTITTVKDESEVLKRKIKAAKSGKFEDETYESIRERLSDYYDDEYIDALIDVYKAYESSYRVYEPEESKVSQKVIEFQPKK